MGVQRRPAGLRVDQPAVGRDGWRAGSAGLDLAVAAKLLALAGAAFCVWMVARRRMVWDDASCAGLVLSVLASIVVVSNAGMSLLHLPVLARSIEYTEHVLGDYGRWLNEHAGASEVVAAYDVGALAYHARRPVLDLVGLNSPEVIPLRLGSNDLLSMMAVQRYRPAYLVTLPDFPLAAYAAALPPYRIVRSARIKSYRFSPAALRRPPREFDVLLLRLDWSRHVTAP